MGRWGEPRGVSSRILVIRGPKGRMKVCIRVVRRERLVWWVISIVSLVEGLRGDVVSAVVLGLRGVVVSVLSLGRLEGGSRWDVIVVVVVSDWESFGSSMVYFFPFSLHSGKSARDSCV